MRAHKDPPPRYRRITLEPIRLPRWVFLAKYLGFALFGLIAGIAGTPSLDLATPDGYRPIWAWFIIAFGLSSFLACLYDQRTLEKWCVLGIISGTSAYLGAVASRATSGDQNVQALAIILFLVLFLPVGRFFTLVFKKAPAL